MVDEEDEEEKESKLLGREDEDRRGQGWDNNEYKKEMICGKRVYT